MMKRTHLRPILALGLIALGALGCASADSDGFEPTASAQAGVATTE
jgi:hypothetical protein